ncbi:MAG: hypothetical protein RRB24_02695 [Armatimonadota bacterium]|nr:hypothetical protein [Armatimonadota bacterium]MDT7971716.1 hypothetical protein [Armatimonadota bacterium]
MSRPQWGQRTVGVAAIAITVLALLTFHLRLGSNCALQKAGWHRDCRSPVGGFCVGAFPKMAALHLSATNCLSFSLTQNAGSDFVAEAILRCG